MLFDDKNKNSKQNIVKKILLCLLIVFALIVSLFVLTRTAQNGRETVTYEPVLSDNPVYVELESKTPLYVELTAKEDMTISGISLLLVNISSDSQGGIEAKLLDDENNILFDTLTPLGEINAGSWFSVGTDARLSQGKVYVIELETDEASPYLMCVDNAEFDAFPFSLSLARNENKTNTDNSELKAASIGVKQVHAVKKTYGEILYFSIPFVIICALIGLFTVIAGRDAFLKQMGSLRVGISNIAQKCGNEIFLILVFAICTVSIISRSYVQGVYITSDSANYLREARNLVAGNNFSYDGLAGYNTWFASWPILYPVFIAICMLIPGLDAYEASKLVAILCVLVILIILRLFAKKDAWIYSLVLLNTGFIELTHYTWSEIPFMVFLLLFAIVMGKILEEQQVSKRRFVLLGVILLCACLTRYFGVFLYAVLAIYMVVLFGAYSANKEKKERQIIRNKLFGLMFAGAFSGGLFVGYMLVNKIKNGMASGVSRTLWWDDYEKLTNDLIGSLLTEFFHIFHLETPEFIVSIDYKLQLFFLWIIVAGVLVLCVKGISRLDTYGVCIVMALTYYVMFTAIRYVSSMDTFYFRFFEPATFILSVGLIGVILPYMRSGKMLGTIRIVAVTLMLLLIVSIIQTGGLNISDSYYGKLTRNWEKTYSQIPEKSVVIFSNLDMRSKYYRPDVVEGTIYPEDTWETVKANYYGSEYMCILTSDAKKMIEEPVYDSEVEAKIRDALTSPGLNTDEANDYICISLR